MTKKLAINVILTLIALSLFAVSSEMAFQDCIQYGVC